VTVKSSAGSGKYFSLILYFGFDDPHACDGREGIISLPLSKDTQANSFAKQLTKQLFNTIIDKIDLYVSFFLHLGERQWPSTEKL
jgi:hypothetical protein